MTEPGLEPRPATPLGLRPVLFGEPHLPGLGHDLGHRKEQPHPSLAGTVPGGHAELCRLLPGTVALSGQALLWLTFLEKKRKGQGCTEEGYLHDSWGFVMSSPKAQGGAPNASLTSTPPREGRALLLLCLEVYN